MARLHKQQAKEYEKALAYAEAERFEAYLDAIESIHRECRDPIDWAYFRDAPEPPRPPEPAPPDRSDVVAAEQALAEHSPGMFERMGVSKKTNKLEAALESRRQEWAIESERRANAHREALSAWEQEHAAWRQRAELAAAILRGDEEAYQWVLSELAPLSELGEIRRQPSAAHPSRSVRASRAHRHAPRRGRRAGLERHRRHCPGAGAHHAGPPGVRLPEGGPVQPGADPHDPPAPHPGGRPEGLA